MNHASWVIVLAVLSTLIVALAVLPRVDGERRRPARPKPRAAPTRREASERARAEDEGMVDRRQET
jgi:hypothetical protein